MSGFYNCNDYSNSAENRNGRLSETENELRHLYEYLRRNSTPNSIPSAPPVAAPYFEDIGLGFENLSNEVRHERTYNSNPSTPMNPFYLSTSDFYRNDNNDMSSRDSFYTSYSPNHLSSPIQEREIIFPQILLEENQHNRRHSLPRRRRSIHRGARGAVSPLVFDYPTQTQAEDNISNEEHLEIRPEEIELNLTLDDLFPTESMERLRISPLPTPNNETEHQEQEQLNENEDDLPPPYEECVTMSRSNSLRAV